MYCRAKHDSNAKQPMISFPQTPFEKFGSDIFTFDKKNYLLTIDYDRRLLTIDYDSRLLTIDYDSRLLTIDYDSRFFKIDLIRSPKLIQKLCVHMFRYGICDICISDNTCQCTSGEFHKFARDWGFQHQIFSTREFIIRKRCGYR